MPGMDLIKFLDMLEEIRRYYRRNAYFRGLVFSVFFLFAVYDICGQSEKPDIVIQGTLTEGEGRYLELPFQVPYNDIVSITFKMNFTGEGQGTILDYGLSDPLGFRGWSGSNKSQFTISETGATASYTGGKIIPGTWKVWLGIPEARAHDTYTIDIFFQERYDSSQEFAFGSAPLIEKQGWYRGDFHIHSGHSDGTTLSRNVKRIPSPVFKVLETAVSKGLDFISLTDHNTVSHFTALDELQPYFDDLLIIAGREQTMPFGHANILGTRSFMDFREGFPGAVSFNQVLENVKKEHGIVTINHPGLYGGWRPKEANMSLIDAIEVVSGNTISRNDGNVEKALSGVSYWTDFLNQGIRLTGIGTSDAHHLVQVNAQDQYIGQVRTYVYASRLSQAAILEGIRSGNAFVEIEGGLKRRLLEMVGSIKGEHVAMGGNLYAEKGEQLRLEINVEGVEEAIIELIVNGKMVSREKSNGKKLQKTMHIELNGTRQWVRVNIRTKEEKLVLMGNPIYINWDDQ